MKLNESLFLCFFFIFNGNLIKFNFAIKFFLCVGVGSEMESGVCLGLLFYYAVVSEFSV